MGLADGMGRALCALLFGEQCAKRCSNFVRWPFALFYSLSIFCQVFQLKFNLIYCYKLSLFIYCPLVRTFKYVALTEVETETDALRKVIQSWPNVLGQPQRWDCRSAPLCIFCNFSNDVYQIIQFGFHTKHFLCEMAKGRAHKAEGVAAPHGPQVKWADEQMCIQTYIRTYGMSLLTN